jgi:hypothetical protein
MSQKTKAQQITEGAPGCCIRTMAEGRWQKDNGRKIARIAGQGGDWYRNSAVVWMQSYLL